jgi:hypothetical protein
MKYKNTFSGKMQGPFDFRYKRNSKSIRPCYIINGYESGLYNVYCPKFALTDGTFLLAEYNLAKCIGPSKDIFVAFGKDNYLTLK